MKNSLILATFVACLLAANITLAQSGAGPGAGPGAAPAGAGGGGPRVIGVGSAPGAFIGLIDFDKTIKGYAKAKYMEDQLQKDRAKAESDLRKEQTAIDADKENLKQYRPGSKEYREIEERMAQRASDLSVRLRIQQRDFAERQQKTMFMLITEISDEVRRYSESHGIQLVFPFSSDPVDMNNPDSIQKTLSKAFVYANANDITEQVLAELNRRALQNAPRTANGAAGGNQLPKR